MFNLTLSNQSRLFAVTVFFSSVFALLIQFNSGENLKTQSLYNERLVKLVQGVFELNILTNEHLSLRSKRSELQWDTRYASLTNLILITMRDFDGNSNKLLLRARNDLSRVHKLFFKILVTEKKVIPVNSTSSYNNAINKMIIQVRLISQKVVSDINRAGTLSINELKKSEDKSRKIFLVTMLVIIGLMIALLLWIQRVVIQPIVTLNEYSDLLAAGNYKAQVNVYGNNEISQLSKSFNTLASAISEKIYDLTNTAKNLKESKIQLESALRLTKLTELQYKDIFYAAADAIVTITSKGIIKTINPACIDLFGYSSDELVGNNISLITGPTDKHKHDTYIHNFIETQQATIIGIGREVYGQHKNGKIISVHLRISEVKRDSGVEFIGILRDITEEKKVSEKLNKNRDLLENTNKELESYAYSISHDLRSPLRSIDGFSLVLLEDYSDQLDDVAKNYLNRIRAGTNKMSILITELLKMSRITKENLNFEEIDLSVIAKNEISILKETYSSNIIEFNCLESINTFGDKSLLQSVIENLLSNAVKYSQGNDVIKIEMGVLTKNNESVIYIKDNGAGFDMKHKNKLFKAFQRLHKVNQFEGTGIGLATVQRIISRHGGEIWAESAVNQGATFYFTIKARKSMELFVNTDKEVKND